MAFEEMCTHLGGEPPGYFAHRCEERERTVGELDRFVCNARRLRCEQCIGDGGIRSKVEVGEQRQILAQVLELLGFRFFDLDHHFLRPGVRSGRHDGRTGCCVIVVGD